MTGSRDQSSVDSAHGINEPYIIGLVGTIASGKSTVASILAELGAEIIDADVVYRDLVAPGSPLFKRIVDRFGTVILDRKGLINRSALGAIVFNDPPALADLDALTHPAVIAEIRNRIGKTTKPVVVIEAVKLAQTELIDDVDSLWVVDADPATRRERLVKHRGLSPSAAQDRIDAFLLPLPQGMIEDVRIDNAGPIECTRRRVALAWQKTVDQHVHLTGGTVSGTQGRQG